MRIHTLGTSLLVLALTGATAFAQPGVSKKAPKGGKADAAAMAAGDKDKPFQDWKKVTKDAEVKKGYFTLYKKRENLYLELRPEQLDKPVLGIFSFAKGIGQNRLLGGLPLNSRLMEFQRSGDRVLVLEKNVLFTAAAGSPMDKARDLSFGNSVLASLKIESEQDSSKAVLVDLAPFLVSDVTDLAENMRGAFPPGKTFRFDKDRSALTTVKTFPENVEIEALLTYSPNNRDNLGLDAVPDERYIPISVHYSFSKLPDVPMQPRLADDRTGFFLTAIKDFSRDNAENFWVRYANRWRLEKKDPTAAVSEVVKPIVYYIDHTVPMEYRPAVKKGVENWQKAFEAAGLKNAIVAKDAPDDPDWDAEDVRYSTIRWITSSVPSFGAIGPSRVDPRTGEILDADILFEASIVASRGNLFRRLNGPGALAAMVWPTISNEPGSLPLEMRCDLQAGMTDGASLLYVARALDGALSPYKPFPKEFTEEMLVDVVMHEVGHTLGLRHNFRSSTATAIAKLNDASWTDPNGMTGSVMDYPTPNIAVDAKAQGRYFNTQVGTCDTWMIRYGYQPSGAADVDGDYAFARKVADESNAAGHEYSTDEDTYPADALDPRTNIFDLGDDPLAFAKERSAYVAALWKNEQYADRIIGSDGDYTVLRRATDTLLGQYGVTLGLAVKYVGGQYASRNHRGQPDMRDPLQPIPAAKQREALDFLAQRAFAADAFAMSPKLLNTLIADRWGHWGMPSNFAPGARVDYNLNDRAFAIQNTLLQRLLAPSTLARLREAESHSASPMRMTELFDRMTRMLWGEVGGGTVAGMKALEGPGTRREVQRAYVDQLAAMVASPAAGTPDDARALARLHLSRIDGRAARVLAAGTPLGDYTRSHLLETRARIKRSLEAGVEADARRGGVTASPAGVAEQP